MPYGHIGLPAFTQPALEYDCFLNFTFQSCSELISACDLAASYSPDYLKANAVRRLGHDAPDPNLESLALDTEVDQALKADLDWFKKLEPGAGDDKLALVFKTAGSPMFSDPDDIRQISRSPLLTIAGSSGRMAEVFGLLHAVQPLSDAAGVLPCFTFGSSPLEVAGNKAFIAKLFFGGSTYYGSYDQYMVLMWWLVRTAVQSQKQLPANFVRRKFPLDSLAQAADAFMVEFLRKDSRAKLGLDPTNSRPMTPTTMYNAFLYTLWGHTEYRIVKPGYDNLRELHPVYEVSLSSFPHP